MNDVLKLKKEIVDTGWGTSKVVYTNADTGEVECIKYLGDVEGAFRKGANTVPAEVFISKEPTKNAEFLIITQIEGMKEVAGKWKKKNEPLFKKDETVKKKQHKTGNKRSYIKVYLTGLDELVEILPDKDLGTLIKMARCADWDTGTLVDVRSKKPLDYRGLKKYLKYSEQTLNNRLTVLKDCDIVTKDDEGYKINRKYIAKG